jgi:predicted transcriptional regulator
MNAQVFVRKNTVGPTQTTRLLFYVNRPVQAIMGAGDFEERVVGNAEDLWQRHGESTIFESHEEYTEFLRGRTRATFIKFRNLIELDLPIPLERLLHRIGRSRLPRSGRYLSEETVRKLMG